MIEMSVIAHNECVDKVAVRIFIIGSKDEKMSVSIGGA